MGFIFPRVLAKYVSPLLASVGRRVNRLFLLFPFRVCLFSPVVVAVSVCLCARVSGFCLYAFQMRNCCRLKYTIPQPTPDGRL